MPNNEPTQLSQNVFEQQSHVTNGQQPRRGVRQDKGAPTFARVASVQPAPLENLSRAQRLETNSYRSQKTNSSRVKLVHLTIWVHPLVKAELQRTAAREGLSVSSVGASLLEQAIQRDIHSQQEALLYPLIRQIIREELRAFGNRIVFFLMRIAFASEQSRILITNILDRILRREGAPEHTLTTLVDQSNTMARRNIIKKTPQIKTLLEEWEASFPDAREEGNKNNG